MALSFKSCRFEIGTKKSFLKFSNGMGVEFDLSYSDLFDGKMDSGSIGRTIQRSFAVINHSTLAPEAWLLSLWIIKAKNGYVPNAGIVKQSNPDVSYYLKSNRFDLPFKNFIENE